MKTSVFSILASFLSIVFAFFITINLDNNHKKETQNEFVKLALEQRIEKRYEQEFEMTKDPKTNTIPRDRLVKAKEYTKKRLSEKSPIPSINWEERGPNNVAGRTRAILIDAADPSGNTVFAGGVGGGLWKTIDGGANWTVINDFFANIAITAIAQDPNNASVIYFGTGEGWFNSDAIKGLGIWKSIDGGATFNQLASTNNVSYDYVNKIVVKGDATSTIFVTTRSNSFCNSGGVFRSLNGGSSFTKVLFSNANCFFGADVEVAANGDIYASIGLVQHFAEDGIYKSTNADNGGSGTWTKVYTSAANEFRIELATAPNDANYVYALIQVGINSSAQPPIILKSTDATSGTPTWTTLPNNQNWFDQDCAVANPDWTRGQAFYDFIAAVDPNNKETVYIGGIDLFKTIDGGMNWSQLTNWAGACGFQEVHADQHAIVYKQGSSTDIWFGNDGGVYKTSNGNAPLPNITFQGNNYNVTQFYAADMHPQALSEYILAGAQDNGTQKFTTSGINSTVEVSGGDGAFCHIDQDNPQIQITSFIRNKYFISIDGGVSFSYRDFNNGGNFINQTDYDDLGNVLYAPYSNLGYFRWNDPAVAGSDSDVLTVTNMNEIITAVKVSPNVPNRIYLGLQSGRVLRVDNANTGVTGTVKASTILYDGPGSVSCIEIQNGNENHMVLSYSNYGIASVFESTDATATTPTFTSLDNASLPDMPVRWALFNPENVDQLLIATEVGVWSTDNINGATTSWGPTNAMLANVRVDMLKTRTSDNRVIAATHGRGVYSTDDFLSCGTITWQGGPISLAWNNPANWDLGRVPTFCDDVIIDELGAFVILNSGNTANAKSLLVDEFPIFVIANDAILNIEGSVNNGIISNGFIHNSGTISIGDDFVIGDQGILMNTSTAVFENTNTGILNINRTLKNGIKINEGIFRNEGLIEIGNQAKVGEDGINNRKTFSNLVGGTIKIDSTGFGGIANFFGGEITNLGDISIGYNGGGIIHQALYNSGLITNGAGSNMSLKGGQFSLMNIDIPNAGPGTFDAQLGSTLNVEQD